ncbi:MAG: hypothetical protein CMH52_12825 [Myxococcales bacterium]|nr:hypothetical protein [Myxococcales bacterium]
MNIHSKILIACLSMSVAFGCGDDSSGASNNRVQDAAVNTDSTSTDGQASQDVGDDASALEPDTALADMGIIEDMDIADAAVDMTPADMGPDPVVVPEVDCMEDDGCAAFERCISNVCQLDPRPDVFVINTVRVTEPENSAGLLQGALQGIIGANQLNLMIEPGGYQADGTYRWYVGNGGLRDGAYDYLGRYPIQNFDGFWRQPVEGDRYWTMENDTPFILNVPAGQVQTAEGVISCMTAFNVTVEISIVPSSDEMGNPRLEMTLSGYLLESDARTVNFLFNGVEVSLTSLLEMTDLNIDTDGDGIPDAYPFDFSGTASAITFVGDPPAMDGSNRDPQPNVQNPPECDER